MKKKVLSTKLSLKKKIIAPLSAVGGSQIVGGALSPANSCLVTCPATCAGFSCDRTCETPTTNQTIRVSECGPFTCLAGCTTVPGTEAC